MEAKPEQSVALIVGSATVYLPLTEMTDVDAEEQRLGKELADAKVALNGVREKLSNEAFTSRAPAHIVERERERLLEYEERVTRLEEQIGRLRGLG